MTDTRSFYPPHKALADPEAIGHAQARRRAGPWPRRGALEDYRKATDRAVQAAKRVFVMEYRWNMRFRLWEQPETTELRQRTARLVARQHLAREIAEDREYILADMVAVAHAATLDALRCQVLAIVGGIDDARPDLLH